VKKKLDKTIFEPKSIDTVKVFKKGTFAGTLERTKNGSRILFSEEFCKSNKNLTFCISTTDLVYEFSGAGLPPYFAGLLPEGLRLKALIKKLKTSPDDFFTLLVATGSEFVGDVHFGDVSGTPSLGMENNLPNDFSLLRTQLMHGNDPGQSSIAGVQEKLSADRISLPLTVKKKNKSYILKLNSLDFENLIENELCCLKIAKACGLNVNRARIVNDIKQKKALLVERFDRQWSPTEKKWLRFQQEDACQFLDRFPADKYRLSLQDIADGMIEFVSSPEIEILNLLKLKAFSYLIGNGDLHAKNISLIRTGDDEVCQLSPCYDLVCTALYGDQKMALQMDGKNQNLKKKNFIDFGLRYRVPAEATTSMLKKLVALFEKHHSEIYSFPLALKKKKFLQQMFKERIGHLK
jgi:serine/threonine-protein kinase HipA